jgi:hypothetical protein
MGGMACGQKRAQKNYRHGRPARNPPEEEFVGPQAKSRLCRSTRAIIYALNRFYRGIPQPGFNILILNFFSYYTPYPHTAAACRAIIPRVF